MLPNFLIVGAMKSGTTTLLRHLERHPDVFVAPRELHFFTRNFAKGPAWYESQFERAGGAKAVGEKTPAYTSLIAFPETPRRVHGLIPEAKLIWIFREPVARAHSQWWHAVRAGSETLQFPEALAAEAERARVQPNLCYVARSSYADQIEAYLRYFPVESMLFLLFEDLLRDQAAVARRAFDFLGVDPDLADGGGSAIRANPGLGRPRVAPLKDLRVALHRLVQRWRARSRSPGLAYTALTPEAWRGFAAAFEAKNKALAALTALDFSAWREPPRG